MVALKAAAIPLHATNVFVWRGGIEGMSDQRHTPATFSPGERTPSTHCTRGWVGPRAGLDTEAIGKILSPLSGIQPQSPGHPACSQTLY
jgi:hypothetical protein